MVEVWRTVRVRLGGDAGTGTIVGRKLWIEVGFGVASWPDSVDRIGVSGCYLLKIIKYIIFIKMFCPINIFFI